MVENADQVATLMIIFGAGYIAVFGVFVLLYWHAYRNRELLDLNELEVFDTREDIQESALNVGIGTVSISFGAVGRGQIRRFGGNDLHALPDRFDAARNDRWVSAGENSKSDLA